MHKHSIKRIVSWDSELRGEKVSDWPHNQRKKWGTDVMIRDVPLFGMWWSGRGFGASFGVKMKGSRRNVHLTIVFGNDTLNCHITDTAKDPEKVWEASMSVDEFYPIYVEFRATCMRKYYWHQKYFQLDDSVVKTMTVLGNPDSAREYDVAPLVEACVNEDVFVKKRIRKGFHEGQRFGLVFEGDDMLFVIPFSKRDMLVMNSDLEKTPFRRIPTVQGFSRYIDYLEEEGLLEQTILGSDRVRIEAAFMSILTESESSKDG